MHELSLSEKREFYSSLLSLYEAGFSYADAFSSIESSTGSKNLNAIAACIRIEIQNGTPFGQIMQKYKQILGVQYALLVKAGDGAGKLEDVLKKVIEEIKRAQNLKSRLISSMIYPVLLFLFALGVLLFCKFFFFKVFSVMFSGGICPASLTVLAIGAFVKILAVYALIFGLFIVFLKNGRAKRAFLDFLCRHTFFAKIFKQYFFGNFFSVMSASYDAGVTVTESTAMAAPLLKTSKMTAGIAKTQKILENGGSITSAYAAAGIFDAAMISKIATGEKTGTLGKSFRSIAQDSERKLQEALDILINLMNPLSILVIGVMVGYIAVSFYSNFYGSLFSSF